MSSVRALAATLVLFAAGAPAALAAPPTADFTYTSPALAGESVSFDANASGADGDSYIDEYLWDFDGDGTFDDDGDEASHTFDVPGTYPVHLRVVDDEGESADVTRSVTVLDHAQVRRAQLTWDTSTDVDLHIWDLEGNHAYYHDLDDIPSANLVEDIIPGFGPEYFEDRQLPWSRVLTYGVCMFDGDGAHTQVQLTDPDGNVHSHDVELGGTGDFVIVGTSPAGATGFAPDPGWCKDQTERNPPPAPVVEPPAPTAHYVAIGDSYSAGEGVDPYFRDGYDRKARTQTGRKDNRCHRATRAYPTWVWPAAFGAPLYQLVSSGVAGTGKRINKYGSDFNVRGSGDVSWAFLACSGATTTNILPAQQGGKAKHQDQAPQLDHPAVNESTSLVTITIGGNDVNFVDVLKHCATKACNNAAYRKELDGRIAGTADDLEKVYAATHAEAPNARVLVLGYPQLFPASRDEQQCGGLRPWRGEQSMLRSKETALNALIAQKAAAAGFEFIDIAAAYAGHEVCGSKGAWLHGVSVTFKPFKLQFIDDEAFHPTLKGQLAMAFAVNSALR